MLRWGEKISRPASLKERLLIDLALFLSGLFLLWAFVRGWPS